MCHERGLRGCVMKGGMRGCVMKGESEGGRVYMSGHI